MEELEGHELNICGVKCTMSSGLIPGKNEVDRFDQKNLRCSAAFRHLAADASFFGQKLVSTPVCLFQFFSSIRVEHWSVGNKLLSLTKNSLFPVAPPGHFSQKWRIFIENICMHACTMCMRIFACTCAFLHAVNQTSITAREGVC